MLQAFSILMTVFSLGATSFANECDLITGDELSPQQLYDFLLKRDPTYNNSIQLFEKAWVDSEFRKRLIANIESQKYLKAASEIGLEAKTKFEKLLLSKIPVKSQGIGSILLPKKRLWELYEAFKKTQRTLLDRPLSEQKAALYSRYDTAAMFGLDPGYSDRDVQMRSEWDAVNRFYNRRLNRYLMSDEAQLVPPDLVETVKLKMWATKTIDYYQQLRAKNLLEMMIAISKYDRRNLRFEVKKSENKRFAGSIRIANDNTALVDAEIQWIDFEANPEAIQSIPEIQVRRAKNYLDKGNVTQYGTSDLNFWKKTLSRYSKPFDYSVPDSVNQTHNDALTVTILDRSFNQVAYEALGYPVDAIPEEVTYAIQIKNIYQFVIDYTDQVGRTDLNADLDQRDELYLALGYDQTLLENIRFLEGQLGKMVPRQFESGLKAMYVAETQQRPNTGTQLEAKDLFYRMRILLDQPVNDALTGVEWFGYRYSSNFWLIRDQFFKTRSKFKTYMRDKWSKSSTLKKIFTLTLPVGMLISLVIKTESTWGPALVKGGDKLYEKIEELREEKPQPKPTERTISPKNPDATKRGDKSKKKPSNVVVFQTQTTVYDTNKVKTDLRVAKAPRFFDMAGKVELSEIQKLQKLSYPYTPKARQSGDSVRSEIFYQNTDSVFLKADDGYVFLPRPEGYELQSFNLWENARWQRDTAIVEGLYFHPNTGQYLIKVKPAYYKSEFSITVNYKKMLDRNMPVSEFLEEVLKFPVVRAEKNIYQFNDVRFKNMNVAKLLSINDSLRSEGFLDLAQQLDSVYQLKRDTAGGITLDDISNVIAKTQLYSTKIPELQPLTGDSSRFSRYRPYLFPDGKLHIKCDIANSLQRDILTLYFADQSDIHFGDYGSYVLDSTEVSSDNIEKGWIKSIQHMRLQIQVKQKKGVVILDATPVTLAPEEESPVKKEKKPNFIFWPETPKPPQPIRINPRTPEAIVGPDPGAIAKHREMVEKLEAQTKLMVQNETLIKITRMKKGVMLPQRVFKLGKQVMYFANREINASAFFENVFSIYPNLKGKTPKTEVEFVDFFAAIETYETEEWRRLMAASDQRYRFNPYTRHGETMYWIDDYGLKVLTLNLLEILKSYHWINPEWPLTNPDSP